jgi:hypothetical protein
MDISIAKVLVLVIMLLASALAAPGWAVAPSRSGQTIISGIVIEGNEELANHSLVRGGSGTESDPYVISDHIINVSSNGRTAIAIRNTTKSYVVRNITILSNAISPAIEIRGLYDNAYFATRGALENVTVIGPGLHLYLYLANFYRVSRCTFVNYQSSGDLINSYWGYSLTFDNNTFDAPGSEFDIGYTCLLYTSPSPRDRQKSRMPSSA